MTSNKLILLGFLFMALGFGLLFLALTQTTFSNYPPANLFFPFPPDGRFTQYLIDVGNIIRLEQGGGLVLLIFGFIVGVIGCSRK